MTIIMKTLKSGHILIHKGREDESINGIGFIICKECVKWIITITAITDRVAFEIPYRK